MDWIIEPFQYAFMKKALLGIILASINCSFIGAYVILRRMSFLGEALTHTLLPGIVFAYLRGFHVFIGAFLASIFTAIGIGVLSSRKDIRQDTAIGVMLSFMFALGVLMMSYIRSFRDFSGILFGSILGITTGDLLLSGVITLIVISTLYFFHKELELNSVDPNYGESIGIRSNVMRYMLLILIAMSVVTAVQMIGALLTTALIIIPAATGTLLSEKLSRVMIISATIALISGIFGLYLSYYFQVTCGGIIVMNCSIFFLISSLGRNQWNKRKKHKRQINV